MKTLIAGDPQSALYGIPPESCSISKSMHYGRAGHSSSLL